MSQLPIHPPSPEEQQKIMEQMYLLMEKQVRSYHKHRHMGSSSSVPVELAQELMESIMYTIGLVGGVYACGDIEEAILLGQSILESKLRKANAMLKLVTDTAPQWQTECRWEALRYLRHYLGQYDYRHLAHKGPEALFYPTLIAPTEDLQGIDSCLFYLNILWIENQIMAGVPEGALEQFWDRLPDETLNPCEPLLINGIGKALLRSGLDPLVMHAGEHRKLSAAWMHMTEEKLRDAAILLCQWLQLKDEAAKQYVKAVIPQLRIWIGTNSDAGAAYPAFL